MGRGVQRNQATSVDFFFFFLRPRNAAGEGGDDEKGQFLLSGSRIPLSLCSRGQAGPGGGLTAGPGSQTAGITAQLSASFPVEMQLGIQRRKPRGPRRSWRAGGTGSPTGRCPPVTCAEKSASLSGAQSPIPQGRAAPLQDLRDPGLVGPGNRLQSPGGATAPGPGLGLELLEGCVLLLGDPGSCLARGLVSREIRGPVAAGTQTARGRRAVGAGRGRETQYVPAGTH